MLKKQVKYEKHYFYLYGSLLFHYFFAACSNDELLPDFIYEMTVSSETINVVSEGATETIEVNSNFNWTVESNAEWCKPTIKGGSAGSSSFQIIVEKNEKN